MARRGRNRKGQFTKRRSSNPRKRSHRRSSRRRRSSRNIMMPNPPRRRGSRRGALLKQKLLSKTSGAVAAGGLAGFAGVGAITNAVAQRWKPAKAGWPRIGVKAAATAAGAWAAHKFAPRPYNKPLALGVLAGGAANVGADAIQLVTKKKGGALKGFVRDIQGDNGDDIGMLGDYEDAAAAEDMQGFTDEGRKVSSGNYQLIESPNYAGI